MVSFEQIRAVVDATLPYEPPPHEEEPPRPNGHAASAIAKNHWPDISASSVGRWKDKHPPDLKMVIAELAPLGMVTLLAAEGGAGKSILQQLALTSCAAHRPFLDRPTMGGAAAGIFAEDPEDVLHIRQNRIDALLNIEISDLAERLYLASYFGIDARLWNDGHTTSLFATIEKQLGLIEDLRIVALDNAAILFGSNENNREEVTAFMQSLNGLAARLNVAIILSTHQSKSRGDDSMNFASGSTAWINAARSALELQTATKDQPTKLILRKANHAKPGLEIPLQWRDAVLTTAPGSLDSVAWLEHGRLDALIFETVETMWRAKSPGSLYRQAKGRYVPQIISSKSGLKAKVVEERINYWIPTGHIVTDQQPNARSSKGLKVAKWPDSVSKPAKLTE